MNLHEYQSYLKSKGGVTGDVRLKQSEDIINATFTEDPTYKKVYVLTTDGWQWEDAKYQQHSTESLSKDAVDYYLQFRPGIKYEVGTYVLVPDESSTELNLTLAELEQPFSQSIERRSQWWIIVGRTETNSFIRYSILKCNWNFKWVYGGKICECYGCIRSANSYTSGVWRDEYTISPDNLTGAWIPDTYYTYGDSISKLHLDDTRSIDYMQRFLLANNLLHPKVYQVTKVVDLTPPGLIKLSIKQDEFNDKRDNLNLMVCDYYSDNGEPRMNDTGNPDPDRYKTSKILPTEVMEDGTLNILEETASVQVAIGKVSYFVVKFSNEGVDPEWEIALIDPEGQYDATKQKYFEGLMKLMKYEDGIIGVKPGKVKSLAGLKFQLNVCSLYGEYRSSIELEVFANET